jgi:thiaminase
MWLDVLDRETQGISRETAEMLKGIFVRCAGYENELWDELYS